MNLANFVQRWLTGETELQHDDPFWRQLFIVIAILMVRAFEIYNNRTWVNLQSIIVDETGTATHNQWIWIINLFTIGDLLGSLSFGHLANRFGRKFLLVTICIVGFLIGALPFGCFFLEPYICVWLLYASRLVLGWTNGISMLLINAYVNELVQSNRRSFYTSVTFVVANLGTLVGSAAGTPTLLGSDSLWPFALMSSSILMLLVLIGANWVPESPRHLYFATMDYDKMKEITTYVQGATIGTQTAEDIKKEHQKSQLRSPKRATYTELFVRPEVRKALLVILGLACLMAIEGGYTYAMYSTLIFEQAGFDHTQASWVSTVVMPLCSIPAIYALSRGDRWGRRRMMLTASATTSITIWGVIILLFVWDTTDQRAIAVAVLMSAWMVADRVFTKLSELLSAELFTQNERAPAMTVFRVLSNICRFISVTIFPLVYPDYGLATALALPYGLGPPLLFIYCWIFLPETANKSFQQIQNEYFNKEKSKEDEAEVKSLLREK